MWVIDTNVPTLLDIRIRTDTARRPIDGAISMDTGTSAERRTPHSGVTTGMNMDPDTGTKTGITGTAIEVMMEDIMVREVRTAARTEGIPALDRTARSR